MAEETQTQSSQAALNKARNEYSALKMRLDVQHLHEKIEYFLRGYQYNIKLIDGRPNVEKVKMGEQLANEKGIQNIMSWITMSINTQTVQGNFPADKHGYSVTYEQAIKSFRLNFGDNLILNLYKWDVDEDQAEGMIDRICFMFEAFLSRCIENKERESYSETIRTIENNTMRARGGLGTFKT